MSNMIIKGNQNTTKLLNQLKSAAKQYQPLSKEQEKELIEKYKNDRETLNKLLFMHNIKVVFNIAKKYMSKTDDFDGLVQDGMNGLSEAIKRFDVERDIKFITYCHPWIKKFIISRFYGKQAELDKVTLSMNAPIISNQLKKNKDQVDSLEDCINEYIDPTQNQQKNIVNQLSSHEQEEICKYLMDSLQQDTSLSSTDKAVFVDIFYNKEKTRDIVEKYGITAKEIINIKKTILSKFKNMLNEDFQIDSYSQISI